MLLKNFNPIRDIGKDVLANSNGLDELGYQNLRGIDIISLLFGKLSVESSIPWLDNTITD
jgi:hypothetical protein